MLNQFVLVTTEHRGVFAGILKENKNSPKEITLDECRMCVYWSEEMRGVMGLASEGPNNKCRISRAIDNVILYDITLIVCCSKKSQQNWKNEPWHS